VVSSLREATGDIEGSALLAGVEPLTDEREPLAIDHGQVRGIDRRERGS